MKTRLIWEKCWTNNDKDSFWIECTDKEVIEKILPYKSDDDFLKEIKHNEGHSLINQNANENIYRNFFLVSTDLTEIKSFIWQMPYSGQWNSSNPFKKIEMVDFNNLNELKVIFNNIKKKVHHN
ncbi:MAG: hypothetical protein ACOYMA_18910 [Bacteroidia bacterium]